LFQSGRNFQRFLYFSVRQDVFGSFA